MPSSLIELQVERPVHGGRMLARSASGVVLVSGAVPGERVLAEVERTARRMTWARTVEVRTASPLRRNAGLDASCGGLDYAHIEYAAQLGFKRDMLIDTFRRVGKITLPDALDVVASPERAYRWRARLHIRAGRAGFFRENTHVWCDPATSGQLSDDALAALAAGIDWLGPLRDWCAEVLLAENLNGDRRVLHVVPRVDATFRDVTIAEPLPDSVTGVTWERDGRLARLAGETHVTDTAADLLGPRATIPADTSWTRSAVSFFQGNRFLTGRLVQEVLDAAVGDRVLDLYAGVGLFSVALAARGAEVVAVEGDRASGADLELNASAVAGRLAVTRASVEGALAGLPAAAFDAVVVDPPRTGLSEDALDGVIRRRAPRIVYVSCDPATLARDAAKLQTAGYGITRVRAFDLFPNTAHVETLALFERI